MTQRVVHGHRRLPFAVALRYDERGVGLFSRPREDVIAGVGLGLIRLSHEGNKGTTSTLIRGAIVSNNV